MGLVLCADEVGWSCTKHSHVPQARCLCSFSKAALLLFAKEQVKLELFVLSEQQSVFPPQF